MGLMFLRELKQDQGLILAQNHETRVNAAIHMMFMHFDLTILWLDKNKVVVDKVLAKKWFPFYFPKKRAKYILELHASQFSEYTIGDELFFS